MRSISSVTSDAFSTGSANSTRTELTSTIHVNSGSRVSVSPGARSATIVTMRLMEAVIVPIPVASSPSAQ